MFRIMNMHAPNPLSAYGRSKLAGEKYALLHPGSMIIRTSWLYSSFGNNFVKTILRHAAEKESLKVVFDQTGTPTYAADLAEAIMHIISGVIRNQVAMNSGFIIIRMKVFAHGMILLLR